MKVRKLVGSNDELDSYTTHWMGDVRVGGSWRVSREGRGQPYTLEGEFLGIDPPRKLVHTWRGAGRPGASTTVTYLLEPLDGGTRITLRHSGFTSRDACTNTCIGWETSFERIEESLATEIASARGPAAARS